jgi:hypothetical protein
MEENPIETQKLEGALEKRRFSLACDGFLSILGPVVQCGG